MNIKNIWTIGHSTRPAEAFLSLLRANEIEVLVDVRSLPGSRKYPHFNKETLSVFLEHNGIRYIHLPGLGGRRKKTPDSKNLAWRNLSFRNYADYMETDAFQESVSELMELAVQDRTCMMCSEAVWWRCHRSMIADYLKAKGWKVWHILSLNNVSEHPYTGAAKIKNGQLSYEQD